VSSTLHIATDGYFTPPTNDGSNPLAIASEYYLGPDLGIFGLSFSSELGSLNFEDLFDGGSNPLRAHITTSSLSVVSGCNGEDKNPFDLRVRIGGVCYKVPFDEAKRIKVKNGGTVFFRTTRHPLEGDNEGRFRLWRHAPVVL
jgi:hypothetical protein